MVDFRACAYQCWAGIDKNHTRGYGYPSNQDRRHGYGDGYDMCSGILARVEFNTRAMPNETHGCLHVCQNRYPRVFGIAKSQMCCIHGFGYDICILDPWPRVSSASNTRKKPHGYCIQKIPVRPVSAPTGIFCQQYPWDP